MTGRSRIDAAQTLAAGDDEVPRRIKGVQPATNTIKENRSIFRRMNVSSQRRISTQEPNRRTLESMESRDFLDTRPEWPRLFAEIQGTPLLAFVAIGDVVLGACPLWLWVVVGLTFLK